MAIFFYTSLIVGGYDVRECRPARSMNFAALGVYIFESAVDLLAGSALTRFRRFDENSDQRKAGNPTLPDQSTSEVL
jgi:hypothetical protein